MVRRCKNAASQDPMCRAVWTGVVLPVHTCLFQSLSCCSPSLAWPLSCSHPLPPCLQGLAQMSLSPWRLCFLVSPAMPEYSALYTYWGADTCLTLSAMGINALAWERGRVAPSNMATISLRWPQSTWDVMCPNWDVLYMLNMPWALKMKKIVKYLMSSFCPYYMLVGQYFPIY